MKRNIFLTLTLSCCLLIACTTDANMPESPKNYVSFSHQRLLQEPLIQNLKMVIRLECTQ